MNITSILRQSTEPLDKDYILRQTALDISKGARQYINLYLSRKLICFCNEMSSIFQVLKSITHGAWLPGAQLLLSTKVSLSTQHSAPSSQTLIYHHLQVRTEVE